MGDSRAAVTQSKGSNFFAVSAIMIAALILLSFPATYFIPLATGAKKFTLLRHLHGLAFFAWVALFVVQTQLVRAGNIGLHRGLGVAGVALAGAMLPLGIWQLVAAAGERQARGFAQPFEFSIYNLVDMVVFITAFGWAVFEASRRIEWHRRLMFVALLNLFGPAFSRLSYRPSIAFPWSDMIPALIADAVLFLLALHDRRQLGRVHPVTLGAMIVLIPLHVASAPIARTQWWNTLAPGLFGFW